MKIKLTKEYKQMADIALSARAPILQYVHVKDSMSEVSDGFILVQKPIDYKGDELLLDAEALKKQKTYPFRWDVDNTRWLVIDGKDQEYPDTQSLYPQDGIKSKVTLSKDKLLRFLKCFDEDDAIVDILIYGDSKPVQFEITNLDDKFYGKGLIMPIIKIDGGK